MWESANLRKRYWKTAINHPDIVSGCLIQVLKKAYIEEKSNDGLPDLAAAKLAWENHKKRNRSIIVELLQVGLTTMHHIPDCDNL